VKPLAGGVVVAAAIATALLPTPSRFVERWYSTGVYPRIQRALTSASNVLPVSMFDLLCVAAILLTVIGMLRAVRRRGWLAGILHVAVRLVVVVAAAYLVFVAAWGLNYRRVPLQEKLQFETSRVSDASADDLAARVVSELNRLYMPAHAAPAPASVDRLVAAFHDAQQALGPGTPIVPGRPKDTLLGGYFHSAAIAGMTDPFFLETLVAPDLLDVERPFVLAHEWAHLAGYADESEANFLAWLTCTRGDAQAQYSAWLSVFGHVYAAAGEKRAILQGLHAGPRIDLRTISDRYANTPRLVRFAARETYDRYLKANGVERGVDSYDGVVQLILGASFDAEGNPRLR
jgi:hypothetical protein